MKVAPLMLGLLVLSGCDKKTTTRVDQALSVRTAEAAPIKPPAVGLDATRWITKHFVVQAAPSRVLVVGATKPKSVRIPAANFAGKGPRPAKEFAATEHFPTLQQAANTARGGDVIAVLPGTYQGFKLENPKQVGPGKFIRIVALGKLGQVVIDRPPAADPQWMVYLSDVSYVTLEGLEIRGTSAPGAPAKGTARAGIFIDGDFQHSGRFSHHIAVVGCHSHHHRVWGLHSTDSSDVLIQDSIFTDSGEEHGAYVSDGSDRYVIRRNVFANNPMSGLQCNLDPLASFEELVRHPKMAKHSGIDGVREWAVKQLAIANKMFGEGAYPDGRGTEFLIEGNVSTNNGKRGAAAFNLAGLSNSVIQNNLIYGNHASGIAQWDNANTFDYSSTDPGPQTPEDAKDPNKLPMFGCQNNLIRNNTILMDKRGRPGVQSRNGSYGTKVYNNVIINDSGPSIEIDNTSIWNFEGSHNVITRIAYEGQADKLQQVARRLPETGAISGVTLGRIAREFVNHGGRAWLDGVAPGRNRPDLRPLSSAKLVVGAALPQLLPTLDFLERQRQHNSIGALDP